MQTHHLLQKGIIEKELKEIIESKDTPLPISEVNLETRLNEDLCLDSMDKMDLITHVESHFNVQISGADTEKLLTVGDIVNYVNDKTCEPA